MAAPPRPQFNLAEEPSESVLENLIRKQYEELDKAGFFKIVRPDGSVKEFSWKVASAKKEKCKTSAYEEFCWECELALMIDDGSEVLPKGERFDVCRNPDGEWFHK